MLSPDPPAAASAEFRRGWRIVAGGAVGTAFGISALPFYTLGVFTKPVAAEFGWTREAVQLGFSAQMLGLLVVGWWYGVQTDRRGPRRVALLSQLGFALGLAALGLVQSQWQWYAAWGLVAVLGGGTSPITWTRGVSDWFDRARGAALGLALLGTGVTGFLAPPAVTAIIATQGWRAGYFALAASVVVVALPLTYALFRDRPEAPGAPRAVSGLSRAAIVRDYRFYALLAVFGAVTFGVGGAIPSLVPLLTDRGLPAPEAARYASLAGLAVIAGRVTAGFLLDRFWAPAVAAVYLMVPAVSCLVLAGHLPASPALLGLAAALLGLAAGAEFDLVAYMVGRYFGMRNYGFAYSLQAVAMLFAGGLAPPLFGRAFDATGSYAPMFEACAAIFLLAPLLLLTLGRYPAAFGHNPKPA